MNVLSWIRTVLNIFTVMATLIAILIVFFLLHKILFIFVRTIDLYINVFFLFYQKKTNKRNQLSK